MIRCKKYLIFIITLFVLYQAGLLLSFKPLVNFACKKISETSNYNVVIDNPRLRTEIIPVINIYANNISVKSKSTDTLLDLSNINIRLRVLPLISGKIHINSFKAKSINGNIRFTTLKRIDKKLSDKLFDSNIVINSVSIDDYSLVLNTKRNIYPIVFKGSDFIFQNKNRYLKFLTKGFINLNKNSSKMFFNIYLPKNNNIKETVFDVDVSSFDMKTFGDYFKDIFDNKISDLSGLINISANKEFLTTELSDFKIVFPEKESSITFPSKMIIKSNFNITKGIVSIGEIKLASKNIDISMNGRILHWFGKSMPTLDLNIIINKSSIEDLIKILPPFIIEEFNSKKLKYYNAMGEILANLSIKGRLPEPDITGQVYANDVNLIKPIQNTLKGATIKMDFLGRDVEYDVVVPAENNQRVYVKGLQEIYNIKYADMHIYSTNRVKLENAQFVLNPLHEILNFIIGPIPIMNITGYGNIDIIVKGNRKDSHIWGVFNFHDADAYFLDMPGFVVKNMDAKITFNNQDIIFKTQNGKLNGLPLNVNGIASVLGKFNFDIESENQQTFLMYKALKSAKLIPDIPNLLPDMKYINGSTDFKLKAYGDVKDIKDLAINRNAFADGEIIIKNNEIGIENYVIKNLCSTILMKANALATKTSAMIEDYHLYADAKIKNQNIDLIFNTPKINPNGFIKNDVLSSDNILPDVSLSAKYNGSINDIDYQKLSFILKILPSDLEKNLNIENGEISLSNNRLNIKNLSGYVQKIENNFKTNMRIDAPFSESPIFNGDFAIKINDLKILNKIIKDGYLPKEIAKYLNDYKFVNGEFDIAGKVNMNKITTELDFENTSFMYLPKNLPLNIVNGKLCIKNNVIYLDKINMLADSMPILFDGEFRNIFQNNRIFDIYINSKPKQEFIDKYINIERIYPIKIKGDMVYTVKLKGKPSDFNLNTKINLNPNSSVYYYGATVGDVENSIVLTLNAKVNNEKKFKIAEFSYDKLINSQSGKSTLLNMLKADGEIEVLKNENNDLFFRNFKIKTAHPVDARIFNIIFGKSNIKQGQFSSDLKLNGKLSNPDVLGEFHIFETDIPFLDISMKNIEFIFKEKTVDIISKGEVWGNDVSINAILKNKLVLPYKIEKATLYTKDLDLNSVIHKLKIAEADNSLSNEVMNTFDINSLIIENLKLKADKIQLRNINASNFEAELDYTKERVLDVKYFIFNIAQGILDGKYNHNIKNNDIRLNLNAKSINANDLSWALFDLKNQIYGDLTGMVNLSCNGESFEKCMETLNGNTEFNVENGKMPKLGSLEYLLRAGNLLKSGLTHLSINSVIDLISPKKIGEFSNIYGNILINDGVADNIEIVTKGDNLSLFISGIYNFANSYAEMEVLGMLSKNISTMFGPIGNVSVNTLFNMIPGVNLSKDSDAMENINRIPGVEFAEKLYRKFIAEIKGNINGENYVKSFKWIN